MRTATAPCTQALRELVFGLHWTPPAAGAPGHDLDALCALLGEGRRVLEVVHPGHPRSADGSIVHTGDSRTGANTWDDERIFVFLDELGPAVDALALVVAHVDGGGLGRVPGARAHVSDRETEVPWLRVSLERPALGAVHCVALVQRRGRSWTLASEPSLGAQLMEDIQRRARKVSLTP